MKRILSLIFIVAAFYGVTYLTQAESLIKISVEPERTKITDSQKDEILLKLKLEAATPSERVPRRRVPLNLSVVLDRSGSMEGAKLEQAKQAACMVVDRLRSEDVFSLITYDDQASVLIAPTLVKNREDLKSAIRGIHTGGSTALYAGVKLGSQQLDKFLNEQKVNRVLLLSDGIANVGPSSPQEMKELGLSLKGKGISVTTIGLGDDYNENVMVALAEASHANYYYVKDTEKLPGIFSEELNELQRIVARSLKIRVVLPEGVVPIVFLGNPEIEFQGRTAIITIPEMPAGTERHFLLQCKLEKVKSSQKIADVTVDYTDEIAGKGVQTQQEAVIAKAKSEDESVQSMNQEVAQSVAITRNRLAKEKAIALADEGRAKEAAQVLKDQILLNQALPASAQTPVLKEDNAKFKQRSDELEQNGSMGRASRKGMQYENFQDKNQKSRSS